MGKKKVSDKVRLFYRGPAVKPGKQADEIAINTIEGVLDACLKERKTDFAVNSCDGRIGAVRPVIGLSASLRYLRRDQIIALIYDDSAAPHLSNYLNHFATKAKIPIMQAHDLASASKTLKRLLVFSFIESPGDRAISHSESVEQLFRLLKEDYSDAHTVSGYQPALIDKVHSTNKSQLKKEVRKTKKSAKKLKCDQNKEARVL